VYDKNNVKIILFLWLEVCFWILNALVHSSISSEKLFPIVWQCIERLECCGFKCRWCILQTEVFRMHQNSDNDATEDGRKDDAIEDGRKYETISGEFKSPTKQPTLTVQITVICILYRMYLL